MLLRERDVGERVFDISTPFRAILYAAGVAGQRLEQFKSLVQSGTTPRRDVEHSSRAFRSRSGAGQQVGGHGIVNVVEITALLAVAKDRRLFAAQHLQAELRQYARVGRRWILPRSKNIEVPQTDRFQP